MFVWVCVHEGVLDMVCVCVCMCLSACEGAYVIDAGTCVCVCVYARACVYECVCVRMSA